VYVDFDNGVDYIQRNAYLLETVIKWVNDHKVGNQPNKMLGLSFGGIIAQWALRDIEEAGSTANNEAYPHQVGLLITHDSPHQGANVPLSIQMLVRKLASTTIRNPIPFSDDIRLVPE
jgi:alpha/beta superfamily hydrolase